MIVFLRRLGGVVGLALIIMACAEAHAAKGKPTVAPSLDVILWMTYPAVTTRQQQSANLVVYDRQGQPVPNATGILLVAVGDYEKEYHFPLTNVEGRASVQIELPPNVVQQSISAKAIVVQSASEQWGEASTEFEIIQ